MEKVGFVSIFPTEHGDISMDFFYEEVQSSHVVLMCSLEVCGTIETKAAPGTMNAIKRHLKCVVLQHYTEPSGPPSSA